MNSLTYIYLILPSSNNFPIKMGSYIENSLIVVKTTQ